MRRGENGRPFWVRTYINMLKNPETQDVIGVFYSLDISAEKRHEEIFDIITGEEYDYVALLHADIRKIEFLNLGRKLHQKYRDAFGKPGVLFDFDAARRLSADSWIDQADRAYYLQSSGVEAVQRELERRGKGRNRHSGVHLFSGKIKCGQCGSWYGSKVWHSTDKYRQVIWQCNHKFDNDERCSTPHLTDDEIKAFFISAVNKLLPEKDRLIKAFDTIKSTAFDTSDLDAEKKALEQEMVVVSEMMQQSIYENARVALDQTEYQKRYDGLTERFGKAKARLEEVTAVISDKATRQATIEDFLRGLQSLDGLVTEFDPMLWVSLVDFITVRSKDDVRVTFKDGTEVNA